MSYHNITTLSKTNAQGQIAPTGYHYMPNGALMLDSEMEQGGDDTTITITGFDLDLSDLPATSGIYFRN